MKGLIKKIKDIWAIEELRNKILFTLGLILIYRIGCFVIIPGVDSEELARLMSSGVQGGFGGLLDIFSGGAFNRASIFSLGIMPYISASIIMQLAGIAVPAVQKMQKEGESGRKKLTQYTRFLTIAITLLQAPGYLASTVAGAVNSGNPTTFWYISTTILLVCCTLFIMWLGEKITDKGIGNGISIIIMIGIIAGLPQALIQEAGAQKFYVFLIEIAALFIVILASVALVQAVRRVPVHFAKSNFASGGELPKGEQARSFIPLKVNSSGVMPIIFAQALMFLPLYLGQVESLQNNSVIQSLSNFNGLWYNVLFALMIILFTYFYTAITVNVNQISDDMKRNGSFVPGIKPGRPTAEYLDVILSRITLPGSIFLAFIAILPAIVMSLGLTANQNFALFFGGTSLLIMVGVVLDTLQQIESHLLSRHYDGLMQSGSLKGRTGMPVSGIIG